MKKYHLRTVGVPLLLLGVLAASSAAAVQRMEDVPPVRLFEAQGVMNYLDLPGGIVSINGKRFRLSSSTMVWGLPDPAVTHEGESRRTFDRPIGYILDARREPPR